ncbi:MAG TPA: AarF/ABC1/UbiB kinase family protein [Anaerolineaceae bacterium]
MPSTPRSLLPQLPWLTRRPLLARSRQIVSAFTRHGLGWLLARLEENRASASRVGIQEVFKHATHRQAAEFVSALVELGPTFIKMGQALSARADLLPPEYIDELSKLQDTIPPTPFDQMREVLVSELGDVPEALYASLDPEPVASASIGQVYNAVLKNGQDVVIKIIRPKALETFERDLEILNDIADWASQHTAIGQVYDLKALVEEFAFTVRNEFDYIREGRNADAFRLNFYGDGRIYIPRVYWELTTHRVITMERVRGIKINDLEGLDKAQINRRQVAENLMHFALRQVFEFGFYHADPHPGNFFVHPDASLAVMDFGMVGRLTSRTKRTFLGIAVAIQRVDTEILVDELLAAGIYTRGIERRALVRDLDRLFDTFSGGAISDLTGTQVFREVMQMALVHNLQLPSELVAMTRAITIAEGTGVMLYPGFQMFTFAGPYVKQFWTDQRAPAAIFPRVGQAAMDSLELGLELPRRMTRLLELLERGQMEVNISMQPLREVMSQMQKMTNRLALSMLLSAVIIALALVLVVYHPATWQSVGEVVFALAFFSSIAFGAWLMWSIIRSGRT